MNAKNEAEADISYKSIHADQSSKEKEKNTFWPPEQPSRHTKIEWKAMASPSDPLLRQHSSRYHQQERRYSPGEEDEQDEQEQPLIARWRRVARDFLSSRRGHYLVLLLVSIDVACSFADFLIEIHLCELTERGSHVAAGWGVTQEVLAIVGLVFSCLFMLELMVTVLSFGTGYFSSKFHIFDAIVIVVAFGVDVALHGIEEELGSLIVVLRLWRVFKIIEELESANEGTLEEYEHEIERLRQENTYLRQRLNVSFDDADPMD